VSGREFADARDVGLASLYGWAARLEAEPQAPLIDEPAFAEIRVTDPARPSMKSEDASARIELVARSGRVIRVAGAVDADNLRVVLEVAERC
jgi:hypothetical protein